MTKISYPDSWAVLSNKELRVALLAYLEEMAAQDVHNDDWLQREGQVDIDEIFHFFFDDTDFWCNASSYVGEALFDVEEAAVVTEVTRCLDEIFKIVGDQAGYEYFSNPKWRDITEKSRAAYLCLQSGDKKLSLD